MNAISRITHFTQDQVARLKLRLAAWRLYHDYKTDPELTAFSALDGDEFIKYEVQ